MYILRKKPRLKIEIEKKTGYSSILSDQSIEIYGFVNDFTPLNH